MHFKTFEKENIHIGDNLNQIHIGWLLHRGVENLVETAVSTGPY